MIMQMVITHFQTTINTHVYFCTSLHLKITLMCVFLFIWAVSILKITASGIKGPCFFFFFFTADRPLQIKSIDPIKQCNMRVLQWCHDSAPYYWLLGSDWHKWQFNWSKITTSHLQLHLALHYLVNGGVGYTWGPRPGPHGLRRLPWPSCWSRSGLQAEIMIFFLNKRVQQVKLNREI